MKKIFLIIMIFSFISSVNGQEIEMKGIYANSSFKKYKTDLGYGFGYNQYFKAKNRLGVSVSQYFSKIPYDDIYGSMIDGESIFIKQVEPNNKRIAFKINYAFRLIDNPKSRIYFGPEIGLNYFIINEQIERIANKNLTGGYFTSDYNKTNRFGIGFIFEYELKEIIHKRISTFLSINPEISSFDKFGTDGGSDPSFIAWINFNFGFRYSLNDK